MRSLAQVLHQNKSIAAENVYMCMCTVARVDSNLSVEAVFEKKLAPLPFTLALSAQANHRKSVFRCGIGLMVG